MGVGSSSFASGFDNVSTDVEMDQDTTWTISPYAKELPCWSDLPSLALEKIFLFLNRKDQTQMSMVCKSWAEEFKAPSIWQSFTFTLREQYLPVGDCPEVRFAKRFGRMFRHLEILCISYLQRIDETSTQLNTFLQTVAQSSQLESIKFENMENYIRQFEDEDEVDDFIYCISNLFASQKMIKSVEFSNIHFLKPDAIAIFESLSCQNPTALKKLKLKNFIKESQHDFIDDFPLDTLRTLNLIMNLEEIHIDYSQMFENIVMSCSAVIVEAQVPLSMRRLKRMKLFCKGSNNVNYQRIETVSWKNFRTQCPALEIELSYVVNRYMINGIETFVVKGMPIKSLHFYRFKRDLEFVGELGSLLRHLVLSEINVYLKHLHVVWIEGTENLSHELINFLSACPKLEIFELYLQHPIEPMDAVFSFLFEAGAKSLKFMYITIGNFHEEKLLRPISILLKFMFL